MNDDAAISIENVHKSFNKKEALKDITSCIKHGQITGLVGPDGAGKTTLIRLMAGLMVPDEGRIAVCGLDSVNDSARIHDIIGYMPQKFGLYEDLSVQENLELYASLKNLQGDEKDKAFERMLSFTALAPFKQRLAGNLSGGMKQKLGLACALLAHPKVLLLDEPSVGVDPISRRELWSMVSALVKDGIAVIWSTSYLDEAQRCDHVLLLNEGTLLFSGPPQELTGRVKGRSFYFPVAQAERRHALMDLLKLPSVIDATIQGKGVRVVLAKDADPQATGFALEPVAARFEDAYIDILGGGPGGESELAKHVGAIAPDNAATIEADSLTKQFAKFTAAHNISFSIKHGEIFGLLGPNGAGKSTTFKMLCGLLKPTQGRALVCGFDLKVSTSEARERIGYMAQKFSLYSDLSVRQNLDFFSGVYGLSGNTRRQKIEEMVNIFNLSSYMNSNAGTLPLGFKQRLALACATMHAPEVLFLDEPTSGVDPITRREFWLHINSLAQKGVTVMVTTHFMDEAEYCDRIALIYQSENIATGTPDELKEQAASQEQPAPTLEDAFIALVQSWDEKNNAQKKAA